MTKRDKLFHRHVDAGAGDAPSSKRLDESRLIDDASTSDVHQMGGRFYPTKRGWMTKPRDGVQQPLRFSKSMLSP